MQLLSTLRPKYQLDMGKVEGSRTTIPAEQFSALTSRRYPYPRVGTRAPNGMFPQQAIDGAMAYGLYTTGVRVSDNPGHLRPKYQSYGPTAYVRAPPIGHNPGHLKPHYTLDKAEIEGVMPASTYQRLTGKITTAPQFLPPERARVQAPYVRAPALQGWDWGTFVVGSVAGGLLTVLFAYGIVPALAEAGAAEIRRKAAARR